MYLTFRDFVGFSAIALGVGLMILGYFIGWNEGVGVFASGLGGVAAGWAYLTYLRR